MVCWVNEKKIVLVTLEMKAKLAGVVFIDPEERLVVLGVNEFHVLFKNKYIV
jgi:hypothetical protein